MIARASLALAAVLLCPPAALAEVAVAGEADAADVAIVNSDGTVDNVIRIGPKAKAAWTLKPGQHFEEAKENAAAEPGGRFDGTTFEKAPLSPEKEAVRAAQEARAQAKQDAADAAEATRAAKDALIEELRQRVEALEAAAK